MNDDQRFKLHFGPYKTPRFKYGAVVQCEVRGECVITGLSDGRIPWPIGKPEGTRNNSIIVYRDLAKAVRKESSHAIRHWWGVGHTTVGRWRKALEVPANNEGTLQLRSEHFREEWGKEAQRKAVAKARDPKRRAKIAAAKRGQKRPRHVVEALRRANTGRKHKKATLRKMSRTHKQRGTRPPWLNEPWTAEEDALVRTLPIKEVAQRTGRTVVAVQNRRRKLKLPDGRRRKSKS